MFKGVTEIQIQKVYEPFSKTSLKLDSSREMSQLSFWYFFICFVLLFLLLFLLLLFFTSHKIFLKKQQWQQQQYGKQNVMSCF